MLVTTYDLDGTPGPALELRCDSSRALLVADQLVLAVSHWGTYMALTLCDRLVLVHVADYERIVGYPCGLVYLSKRAGT
ncbi:MAG TPA: hypothetical protein VNL77_12325 [Roseiflexaceae bacterium]|nr:hypothetical protein [Roseiflexaceae bacterium]